MKKWIRRALCQAVLMTLGQLAVANPVALPNQPPSAISSGAQLPTTNLAPPAANKASVVEPWTFTLRNAAILRDFKTDEVKDRGSWTQGASLFYNSALYDTPLKVADTPIQVGLDASLQYAVRLSGDRHVADYILPFDPVTQTQASDALKHGATLKVGYDKSLLRVGELWLDTPITSGDRSRQLQVSYWGANLKVPVNDQLGVELGRVTKVSGRAEEDFRKFALTWNGATHISDGLDYLDVRYAITPNLKTEYYFGRLESLFDTHYLTLEHTYKQPNYSLTSKAKWFNHSNSDYLNVDSNLMSLSGTVKTGNHTATLGYQQVTGEAPYVLLDGYLAEWYFLNMNVGVFNKKDEKSVHAIYSYDFKDYVPGLKTILAYSYGKDFKTGNVDNKEQEADLVVNYDFQQPKLKGLGLQWIFIDYNIDSETATIKDFQENRFFVNYKRRF